LPVIPILPDVLVTRHVRPAVRRLIGARSAGATDLPARNNMHRDNRPGKASGRWQTCY
jgi:hypothetical protein